MKIIEALHVASLRATEELLAEHEQVYALALYTADDGLSVAMAANTEEAYQAHLESEDEDEENSPEDVAYYRWAPAEWKLEGWRSDLFSPANALILDVDKTDFDQYFEDLIDAMTTVLIELKAAIGDRLSNVTAFVTVTDSDEAEAIENASAERINAPDLARSFQSRFG